MALLTSYRDANDQALLDGSVCAFGVFDGVHLGHRHLIAETLAEARLRQKPCYILTFSEDPDEIFAPVRLKKLMSNEDRLQTLAAFELDGVIVLPFDRIIASLSPDDFLDQYLGPATPSLFSMGSNGRFGAGARGTIEDLRRWGEDHGMEVASFELLSYGGEPVTSTRIRQCLASGQVEEATLLLDEPYHLSGVVRHGRGQGRSFGFRTANLEVSPQLLAVGDGVYGGYAWIEDKRYRAAISVGLPPSFQGSAHANLEAHILDFSGDLYGRTLRLEFRHWLRPMMSFPNQKVLVDTVLGNIAWVRENL